LIEDLWYKNAVFYCLDVETFMDGNGDGTGDFEGLKRRLDYLAGLGVTCIWLQPFHKSPNRDNGYDITDFYSVEPRLGDLGDFVAFTHQAKLHGLRVITDLVVNHTSDQHPWFQAARSDRKSKFRDWYVWSESKPPDAHKGMVFPGEQKSTWSWDEAAGAWYYHRFFDFQPDLNTSNPEVRAEILKIIGFWLELGVSGFRVDAVPFLIERSRGMGPTGDLIREIRELLSWRRGDAVLLAEANVSWDEAEEFFGEGDRMQLIFNFAVNQAMYISLVQGDARPIAKQLARSRTSRPTAQWAYFLRNHDELDLGRLKPAERREVGKQLGPDKSMWLYDRGLRRRLAPMLGGDRGKLELLHSLLLTLPGTPVLWYGDELGMGEDLELDQRTAVRTPMQWSDEKNGGFSTAEQLVRPMVSDKKFAPAKVNVAAQRREPNSLLNWIERRIRLRKECPEIGWGSFKILTADDPAILALRHEWRGNVMITVHNFSSKPKTLTVTRAQAGEHLVDLIDTGHSHAGADGKHKIRLAPLGYRWFRSGSHDAAAARKPDA
jgi:maltose alpha-D-glucosyltransferase / alpha-amylase